MEVCFIVPRGRNFFIDAYNVRVIQKDNKV